MVTPVRTTIMMRPALFERLKIFTRETDRPMSAVVEEGITAVLERHEQERLDKMYQGLFELSGMIQDPDLIDVSGNIDEILYGENGAWRGDHD
jgi:predicted transcriptional regulator